MFGKDKKTKFETIEVCIFSSIDVWPPDLDCEDIPYRNFTVLYPDQHKFDGDKDGIGCEK